MRKCADACRRFPIHLADLQTISRYFTNLSFS